ncbi:hypothetical protein FJV41_12255 [Myxococcus llanfairpwllgwyngyllgogerychwyrndrobwllllantysiliogogogochensis]|uniref:Lipoprotein n=1 Tax=Myxococcus llanfairpwllgwyngyllgogerychwyrndrobwllllantysiliogogogochensis TaxID=2590453 RepID=A0A540X346_9BACT|nr:hypothetical protein [Myxococcus llanfairpwllgwyngyllgogerychwyrndrobwllllantysiliogogogochensis]TQF15656.1 hypothetical protein FJV41_12255 [Myxococcus llanfairpwllgwyngyllgogerychwyrndrobwllllantysiliogogogochensis]
MNRPFSSAALAAALVALSPLGALAGSVYLNGVLIDGVTNQKFEKATVRIDEAGNIHIDAPGYRASTSSVTPPPTAPAQAAAPPATPGTTPAAAQPSTPQAMAVPAAAQGTPPAAATPAVATTPGRITQRYWLVTEQTVPGMTEYDIDVYVNSRWLRKLRGNEDQVVVDVTKHLQPGSNQVMLMARKVSTGSRRSDSPKHVFRVIIGEGNEGGGNVMIDNPLIRFQTTAAESKDVTQEFTLTTR